MKDTFYLKRGDTSPSLRFQLIPKTVVLTGATVRFSMRSTDPAAVKVNRADAVVEVATGDPTVRYDWVAADVDTDGIYEADFEVTHAGGRVEHFPNEDYIRVVISGSAHDVP